MLDGIPWPAFSVAAGGWVIAFACAFGLIRGVLVARKTLEDVIHDRDQWRTESRIKDQQIAEKDLQLRYMGEVGEMQKQVLTSLQVMQRNGGEQ